MQTELPLEQIQTQPTSPAILKIQEERSQRLLLVNILTGLFFMLLPGTFLGVWNLIGISSQEKAGSISPSWIQAHGHAQIFGWIGTFILGIGFYSIPKMRNQGRAVTAFNPGLLSWGLWTIGVMLRWLTNVYGWHWRIALPFSAVLELAAFLIFWRTISAHHSGSSESAGPLRGPIWILAVLAGTVGFLSGLLLNLAGTIYVAGWSTDPAFPKSFDVRFLFLLAFGFIIPTIWGFSARWLPVFLGLQPLREKALRWGLGVTLMAVVLALAGFMKAAAWLVPLAAVLAMVGLRLAEGTVHPPKTQGVHQSFPVFVRLAYAWLLVSTGLAVAAAYFDHNNGFTGAYRHALTVGFVSSMVFCIGQRVLPAFAGMKLLFSPHLMFVSLMLLNIGCTLRVLGEILAYENYAQAGWKLLPISAVIELSAVTAFAVNLLLTFKQPPAHVVLGTIKTQQGGPETLRRIG
jgi:uncharacterized protein involved in response to NO